MIVGRGSTVPGAETHAGTIAAKFAWRMPIIVGLPFASRLRIESSFSPSVKKFGDVNVPRYCA